MGGRQSVDATARVRRWSIVEVFPNSDEREGERIHVEITDYTWLHCPEVEALREIADRGGVVTPTTADDRVLDWVHLRGADAAAAATSDPIPAATDAILFAVLDNYPTVREPKKEKEITRRAEEQRDYSSAHRCLRLCPQASPPGCRAWGLLCVGGLWAAAGARDGRRPTPRGPPHRQPVGGVDERACRRCG